MDPLEIQSSLQICSIHKYVSLPDKKKKKHGSCVIVSALQIRDEVTKLDNLGLGNISEFAG